MSLANPLSSSSSRSMWRLPLLLFFVAPLLLLAPRFAQAQDDSNDPPAKEEAVEAAADEAAKDKVVENAKEEATELPAEAVAAVEPKLKFNFQFAPWKEVIQWLADEADLSLQMEVPPPGAFNYTDSRAYSLKETMDLINGVLQFRGYTLVRNRRMLIVVNVAEDGLPPGLIETISPEELGERGKYEQVKCLFPLGNMTPEDAEREIRPLIPDPNAMKIMPTSRQILLQGSGGDLRMIQAIINSANEASGARGDNVDVHTLEFITAEEMMAIARPLLGIDEDELSTPDGSLNIAFEALGQRLFYSGKSEMVDRFKQIIEKVDVDPGISDSPPPEQLQLEIHPVRADPESVLQVLQTIFAGQEGVRLATDPVTGNLIALARPSQHATIRSIIKQMEQETTQFEVIQLRRYDPQSMVLMLNKLLGKDLEENVGKGPTFDGDPTTMQLVVRGTVAEVEQIRDIVNKMDSPLGVDGEDFRVNSRLIPLAGGQMNDVLDMADLLWPTRQRENRIRRVMPKNRNRSLDERGADPDVQPNTSPNNDTPPNLDAKPAADQPEPATDKAARFRTSRVQVRFVGIEKRKLQTVSQNEQSERENASKQSKEADDVPKANTTGAEIVVTIVPNGIIISSDDLDALDDYEELLRSLMGGNMLPPKPTIFYLKNAKAEEASALLQGILGLSSGGGGGGGGGGGFGGLGDMASNLMGGVGGDLLGGLLGGMGGDSGGSSSLQTTGSVSITADARLNVLVVQANSADMDLIEQLLDIIDQDSPPQEPDTAGKTYIVTVNYMPASEMATIVKQAFPENIVGADASSQRRQPSPQDLLRAFAGRGGQRGGGGNEQLSEERKMTISVDARSNSLVVTGPEHLYKKVVDLVERLDQEGLDTTETFSIVQLKGSISGSSLRNSLQALLGDSIRTSTSSSGTSTTQPQGQPAPSNPQEQPYQQSNFDQFRRQLEFMQNLQRQRGRQGGDQGGGRPSGAPGGGPPGRGR